MIALIVYLLALACWIGTIVFFSFVIAPSVFGTLALHDAGNLMSVIFPQYYVVGYVAGLTAAILAVVFTVMRGARLWWGATALLLAIAFALTLYAGMVIRPRVDSIRTVVEQQNPDPAQKAEFDRLHHLSIVINGAVLLLNLAALVGTAGALTPRG
jgi:Domain of unknown function (DUF4149)